MMDLLSFSLNAIGLLVVVVAVWGVLAHRLLSQIQSKVAEAWREVWVELQRRHDLAAKLVDTVREQGIAEKKILEDLLSARNTAAMKELAPTQQAAQENLLSAAFDQLFMSTPIPPEAPAYQGFQQLQAELTNTEDRIAAGRRYYNTNARDFNAKRNSFPSFLIAKIFKFSAAEYFQPEDPVARTAPNLNFTNCRDRLEQH